MIPPQYVKAYVRGNKNDYNDALAIAEAVVRPQMRFAAIKTGISGAAQPRHLHQQDRCQRQLSGRSD